MIDEASLVRAVFTGSRTNGLLHGKLHGLDDAPITGMLVHETKTRTDPHTRGRPRVKQCTYICAHLPMCFRLYSRPGGETRHVADEAAAERIAADPQLTVEPRWL